MMKKNSILMGGSLAIICLISSALHASNEDDGVKVTLPAGAEIPTPQQNDDEEYIDSYSQNKIYKKDIEVNSANFIKLKEKPTEIFIPNPDIADVEMLNDSSLYLIGVKPGMTSLVINGKGGKVIANYKIGVTYPIKAIKNTISEMYPDASVELLSIENSIIIRGRAPSPEVAAGIEEIVARFADGSKITNRLEIATATQVMLKVRIAEISRSLSKELGINWKTITNPSSSSGLTCGFLASGTDLSKDLLTSGDKWLIQTGGANSLIGLLDAMAQESFASILAEPTLIALSGKKATFNAGGEKGYFVMQDGTSSKTTEFKQWGTSIEFTPTVLSEDRINIVVKPTVSSLESTDKDMAPSLNTKTAETTVELGSGQSLAIAGLLQAEKSNVSRETPLLSDLPLFGSLFKSSKIENKERELIIIVTPYIVKPSSTRLKTPIDMMPKMYSPLETILSRKFHKTVSKCPCAGFAVR